MPKYECRKCGHQFDEPDKSRAIIVKNSIVYKVCPLCKSRKYFEIEEEIKSKEKNESLKEKLYKLGCFPQLTDIENSKKYIRKIDPYGDNWNTSHFPYMSDEQLFKVLHKTMSGLLSRIVDLKKELGWGIHIDDIGRTQISNLLLMELQKRFFKEEIIPVKKINT